MGAMVRNGAAGPPEAARKRPRRRVCSAGEFDMGREHGPRGVARGGLGVRHDRRQRRELAWPLAALRSAADRWSLGVETRYESPYRFFGRDEALVVELTEVDPPRRAGLAPGGCRAPRR